MREHQQVHEGQIVRVIDGPFSGFLGEVTAVGEQIVNVAVQVFGRATPVDLALGQIELAAEKSNWDTTEILRFAQDDGWAVFTASGRRSGLALPALTALTLSGHPRPATTGDSPAAGGRLRFAAVTIRQRCGKISRG